MKEVKKPIHPFDVVFVRYFTARKKFLIAQPRIRLMSTILSRLRCPMLMILLLMCILVSMSLGVFIFTSVLHIHTEMLKIDKTRALPPHILKKMCNELREHLEIYQNVIETLGHTVRDFAFWFNPVLGVEVEIYLQAHRSTHYVCSGLEKKYRALL